jgi:tetratricopeptide (TPR) repeat protein
MSVRSPQPEPEPDLRSTNVLARWLKGEEMPKLTLEQVESYLAANQRSAGSLLAAYQATGDKSLLQEAKTKHPNDPAVAFTALSKSDSAEERRQWLDTLKRVAPDNALADYLSANEYLKAGRTDDAVRELETAYSKPKLQDYWVERLQNAEEAYQAAGYSAADAKGAAAASLELPQLAQFKQLAQSVLDLAASYRQAGDEASAQAALQIGSNLGQRLSTGQDTWIQDLVGMAVERLALSALDPASPYGTGGQTVKDRMEDLLQQRKTHKDLAQSSDGLLANLPEPDLVTYLDRQKMFGAYPAMQWLVAKYGKQ